MKAVQQFNEVSIRRRPQCAVCGIQKCLPPLPHLHTTGSIRFREVPCSRLGSYVGASVGSRRCYIYNVATNAHNLTRLGSLGPHRVCAGQRDVLGPAGQRSKKHCLLPPDVQPQPKANGRVLTSVATDGFVCYVHATSRGVGYCSVLEAVHGRETYRRHQVVRQNLGR